MRTLFEGWAMRRLMSLLRINKGDYASMETEIAWQAWQASWEHALQFVRAKTAELDSAYVYPYEADDRGDYIL